MRRLLRFFLTNHRIGRPFGIDLGIHGTLIGFAAFIVLSQIVSGGIGAALEVSLFIGVLFTSVALHELGHSLAARQFGVGTRAITLLPIGGIAMLEGEFGAYYRVTADSGRSIVCRLNDRGPYIKGRIIDLSHAAMRALHPTAGLLNVTVQRIPERELPPWLWQGG